MSAWISEAGAFLAGDNAQSVYWALALAGSVIFVISLILQFLGVGGGGLPDDVDVNFDGQVDIPHPDTGFPDLQLFSFRALMAFVTMFGWGGVLFGSRGWGGFFIALGSGLLVWFVTGLLVAQLLKLRQNGNVPASALVGKSGTVYLTIPAKRRGAGKVNLNLGNATREIRAYAEEELPTGTPVRVTEHLGDGIFLVEKN